MSAEGYTSIATARELREAAERDWFDERFGQWRRDEGEDYWGQRIAEAFHSLRKGERDG